MQDTIGIDVSKSLLDAFCLTTGTRRQFANDRSGCAMLLRWIGRACVRVVFEPSGPYHRLLEQLLTRAGIAVVNPHPSDSTTGVSAGLTQPDQTSASH